MKEKHKLYIVRKYVKAKNVAHALRQEKTTPVHDVFVDHDTWKRKELTDAIGFEMPIPEEEEDE